MPNCAKHSIRADGHHCSGLRVSDKKPIGPLAGRIISHPSCRNPLVINPCDTLYPPGTRRVYKYVGFIRTHSAGHRPLWLRQPGRERPGMPRKFPRPRRLHLSGQKPTSRRMSQRNTRTTNPGCGRRGANARCTCKYSPARLPAGMYFTRAAPADFVVRRARQSHRLKSGGENRRRLQTHPGSPTPLLSQQP